MVAKYMLGSQRLVQMASGWHGGNLVMPRSDFWDLVIPSKLEASIPVELILLYIQPMALVTHPASIHSK